MDESPRIRRNPADKHQSARRLFSHPATERLRHKEFHTRRRLVLEDHPPDAHIDDTRRETNVVAKLMGLEALPEAELQHRHSATSVSSSVSTSFQHVNDNSINKSTPAQEVMQLHQLLKIKEPLLLRELLRETDDHPSVTFRKPTLMQKFAGIVKRRQSELTISKSEEKSRKNGLLLSPVRAGNSPIKSPCKNKRGLMLEAAVKFLDADSSHQHQQQQHVKKVAKEKHRRFSLSRSSSEPCMSTSSTRTNFREELKEGWAKLSELSRRFGSGNTTSKGVVKSREHSSNNNNLVRSKSDLGLGKSCKTDRQVGGLGLGLLQRQEQLKQDHSGGLHHHHLSLSKTAKTETNNSTHNNNSRILRLFGSHRGRDNRTKSDALSDTGSSTSKTSSEGSSLVRALLRRRSTSVKNHHHRDKPVQVKRPEHEVVAAQTSNCDELTSASESSQFSDEFSDDTDRVSGSPSSSTSNSRSECNKSGQPSPVSVLEAVFVDELHSSLDSHSSCSSIEDSPDICTRPRDSTSSSDNIINAILDISRIRCIDLSTLGINANARLEDTSTLYVDEVLTASKFICEQSPGSDWYSEGLPLPLETLSFLEEKPSTASRLVHSRKLIFDCVDEALDVKLGWCRGRGGSVWAALARQPGGRPRRVEREEVVAEVDGQIREWSSMSSCTTDELVEKDMSFGVGRWRDWNEEVEEIARDVECSILRKLIQEVVMEVGALT